MNNEEYECDYCHGVIGVFESATIEDAIFEYDGTFCSIKCYEEFQEELENLLKTWRNY